MNNEHITDALIVRPQHITPQHITDALLLVECEDCGSLARVGEECPNSRS